jgi:hypothetical protein
VSKTRSALKSYSWEELYRSKQGKMSSDRSLTKKYRVKLGLFEFEIECRSKDEAIRLARTKLSDDMPRLYDVIHDIEDPEFQVDEIEGDSTM